VIVGGRALNTQQIGSGTLQAVVPADIADTVRADGLKVQVKDLAVPDLVSVNDKELRIFGPQVTALRTMVQTVVAGSKSFGLRIAGNNFREGARLSPSQRWVFTAVNIQRLGTRPSGSPFRCTYFRSPDTGVLVRNPDGK
jgi:hypothetical protein